MYGLGLTIGLLLFMVLVELIIYFMKRIYKSPNNKIIFYIQSSVLCFFIFVQPGIM